MSKSVIAAFAAAAALLGTGAAHAGNVYWSIGISTPPVGTVISNAPVYAPAPVVVAPAPVYVPAPVVYQPAPVYVPAPVVRPAPRVVYAPVPVVYRGGHRHGAWGDRDHDGIPNWQDRRDNRWDNRFDGRRYPHDGRR